MESLQLKPRKPVEEIVENWDDDDFMIGDDGDLAFRNHSTASSTHATSNSRRRDSRSSFRSDRDSLPSDDHQVHLPGDDEKSTLDAIAAATDAGIPIPVNVPPSALVGGTIKRLGVRKIKKIFQEDWGDELVLPAPGQTLRLKTQDGNKFPDAFPQVSSPTSPVRAMTFLPTLAQLSPPSTGQRKSLAAPINLEKFRDTDDDDDMFGDSHSTIKASKFQVKGRPVSLITPPTPSPPQISKETDDDFENDLELPSDGKLKLSSKRDIPKTPSLHANDDFDWGEGSLGTRFGGTRRDAFSNRSSSVSAMSPSIASSFTAESEDEFFDGLIFPIGPLDLGERLKRRKQSRSPGRLDLSKPQQANKRPSSPKISSPTRYSAKSASPNPKSPRRGGLASRAFQVNRDEEDLVSGLDLGEGNVFRFAKPTVHRNVKVKEARPVSPVRPKAAVSITFTNKPINAISSRLPRPMIGHERSHTQSSLEPVSESGDPIPQKPPRRPQSRLSGHSAHSAHSSVSSVHTPTTPSSTQSNFPPTPRRKELCQKASAGALRTEPTTTSAQLLRLKRSLPAMRHGQPPAKHVINRTDRPPSRGDSRTDVYRPQSSLRPKTPVERTRPVYESGAAQARKGQVPFLPAGASQSQSHHVNAKNLRSFRRHDSEQGPEIRPISRALSRNGLRSPSPRRSKTDKSTPEPAWQQINKPRRVRHFGDGHELDAFDDLPTSAQIESRYTKQPSGSGNRINIRNKIYQNVLPDRNTFSPVLPYSQSRLEAQPRFARDTAASRIARETSLAQRAQPTSSFVPLNLQRVTQLSSRANINSHVSLNHGRSKKSRKPQQLKPHLISNLNSAKDSKVINGMRYNPTTYRWEGNETALNAFDIPASSPATTPLPQSTTRERETTTPRPVLITNINTKKETRRIGDMVFDPQNMCWLEIKTSTPTGLQSDDPMAGFAALEEEDPFKDIPDLEDKKPSRSASGRVSDIREDWLVGEEFDVGPEFVRRQHEEEARWRRKCEKWTGKVSRNRVDWRWTIRDIVMQAP
ncbi:putative cytokinesis regulator [Rosellinia necatrix]|uniref:Putative cytokinesis regulator n=1 Tax=Rosellinia necatrix TaxID=77044 RepID=A0A1W2TCD4_ROSNE|nr:putative cytokinesis regulator [Rosellinia necatrix]